jgi:hypothetical protein
MDPGRGDAVIPALVAVSANSVDLCDAHSWNLNKSSKSYSASVALGYGFGGAGM